MYKIIGADQKEYGPITAEQLRQWIAEGRVSMQTRVLPEGATEWKTVGELPEFAGTPPPGAPPIPTIQAPVPAGMDQVNGPAIGLMVVAGIGCLLQIVSLIFNLAGATILASQQIPREAWVNAFSGTVGAIGNVLGILCSGVVLWGAIKMKRLENYGLAMAASIIAMVPCFSPCCILGLPIGIWAVVVLSKPEVKSAFH